MLNFKIKFKYLSYLLIVITTIIFFIANFIINNFMSFNNKGKIFKKAYDANIYYNFIDALKIKIYKFWYVKYQRIFNNKLKYRFTEQDLNSAIINAKSQPWVIEQILADLEPFIKDNLNEEIINNIYTDLLKYEQLKPFLVKFKIKNHHIQVELNADIAKSRAYKTIYAVIKILNEYHLIPDCVFIIFLNDYLHYIPTEIRKPIPILSFAKDINIPIENKVILIPDWMNIYYWDVLKDRIELAKKIYPWYKKESLIHWQGGMADSLQHRIKLINLKNTLNFLEVNATQGNNSVPFLDPEFSLKYKYQVALDGARCTWERVVWQMHSNCLMIKPKSTQMQWFYRGLKKDYNYFLIEDIDEENLIKAYQWLINNDVKVQKIIENANQFARNNFKTQDYFAYYVLLLQEYAKLMKN